MNDNDDSDKQDRLWLSLIASRGRDAEGALRGLYDKYRKRLLRFLVHQGASEDAAEEIVQDTFLKVWKSAESFRQDAKASSWIHTIAKNGLISRARRASPVAFMDEEALQASEAVYRENNATACLLAVRSQDAQTALQECYEHAYGQFAGQFPGCAEALNRVVQDGWSIDEVAAMLQRTNGATREFLSQCRKKLKRFLEPCAPLLKELV